MISWCAQEGCQRRCECNWSFDQERSGRAERESGQSSGSWLVPVERRTGSGPSTRSAPLDEDLGERIWKH